MNCSELISPCEEERQLENNLRKRKGSREPGAGQPWVSIAGAGPAGLAAAIAVAMAGGRARVFEQHADVGQRFHGDFQGLENWTARTDVLDELAAIGIEPRFEHTPFKEFVIFDRGGREYLCRSARPLFYIVRRGPEPGTLDQALKESAIERGVEIKFNERIETLPAGGIVAHGPRRADGIVAGYIFDSNAPNGAYGIISNWVAPHGYAYLLVSGGRATLATCMFDDFHNERIYLERAARLFERYAGVRPENPRLFGGFANFAPDTPLRRGKLLYAGEAAGLQDGLFGFGMRLAMLSGHFAGRAMVDHTPQSYEAAIRSEILPLLQASATNRYLYELLGQSGQRLVMAWASRSDDIGDSFYRHYHARWRTKLLHPWVRWRRTREPVVPAEVCEGCDCTWCRCQRDA